MFSVSRRSFLATAGGWLAASSLRLPARDASRRIVSLIHTTDLHGHILPTRSYDGVEDLGGFARCATMIRRWRQRNPHSLVLDIGDVYQGTPVSHANGGAMMMELFNRLGYDAWAPGNHDFDWGPEITHRNLALSKPEILAANLSANGKPIGQAEGDWAKVRPWVLKEVDGFRIALIGLITPGLPYWLTPETLGGVEAMDPVAPLQRCIAEAREAKADAIVLLAHMGWRHQDDYANPVRAMLRDAPGVDVMLAGHSHQDKPSWNAGPVLCSQSSYHGIHCGRLDLVFDPAARRLVSCEATTVLMDESIDADPAVMEIADPELKKSAEQLARKVATVTEVIPGTGRGNKLAELFCTIFSEALKRAGSPVDGVFHGTFGTGDLPPGELTVADCWRLIPYENLLVTARMTGRDLADIIKADRGNRRSDRLLWPFEIRLGAEGDITRFRHDGKDVPADGTFTIAVNSYDGQSGGRSMPELRAILQRPDAMRHTTGIDTRGALIEGFLNRGTLPG